MTIGHRIAQKRKELGLSQEALGAELGVSRQAIYKWESDSSLPEVEKLVLLARRFEVSVGWLLGVEETTDAAQESPAPQELTASQLQMVEEIVRQYLASQPEQAPRPVKRSRWPILLASAVILIAGIHLFSRLEQLDQRYSNLQNALNSVNSNVDSQISSISCRVEELLKSQNNLTAEYDAELNHVEFYSGGSNAAFSAYAVPKTYTEGMSAEFLADNGLSVTTVPCQADRNGKFTAEISCPLTDNMTLSVTFIHPDGTRQTQLLEQFSYCLSSTYPQIEVNANRFFGEELPNNTLSLTEAYVLLRCEAPELGDAEVAGLRVGLFRNQVLQAWAEPCPQPENYYGFEEFDFYQLPYLTLTELQPGETIEFAALVTDCYGRQYMSADIPLVVTENEKGGSAYLSYPADGRYSHEITDWTLEQE